jgi:hypothetical protein
MFSLTQVRFGSVLRTVRCREAVAAFIQSLAPLRYGWRVEFKSVRQIGVPGQRAGPSYGFRSPLSAPIREEVFCSACFFNSAYRCSKSRRCSFE